MTHEKYLACTLGVLLTIAAAATAWAGEVTFEFDKNEFTDPTALTNDYWGLRLGGPSSAAFFSESVDGCEVGLSVVTGTTGSGFFAGAGGSYDVSAVVVHDREWVDEECSGNYTLIEDTDDWYAQDDDGNVWYLGEDTTAWDEDGACLRKSGSWKAGDDGAIPGVIMLAEPLPGASYQQEYYEGAAEDWAKVLQLSTPVSIEFGDYVGCLKTKEYSPLEPGAVEHKYYCKLSEGGVGLTLINELKGKTKRVEYIGTGLPAGEFAEHFPDPQAPFCAE